MLLKNICPNDLIALFGIVVYVQGIPLKFEQTLGGSTAQTVYARETCDTWKDGHDIQEYEAKRILKIPAVVFEQF